ncbi:hypothetical protein ACOMHN_030084 [Nucella lapillus]
MDQGTGDNAHTEFTHETDSIVVKLELPWSVKEEPQDHDLPSALFSTVQPLSDSTSESLLADHVCQRCSAVFMLSSSLEVHMQTFHAEALHTDSSATSSLSETSCGERLKSEPPEASRLPEHGGENTDQPNPCLQKLAPNRRRSAVSAAVTSLAMFLLLIGPLPEDGARKGAGCVARTTKGPTPRSCVATAQTDQDSVLIRVSREVLPTEGSDAGENEDSDAGQKEDSDASETLDNASDDSEDDDTERWRDSDGVIDIVSEDDDSERWRDSDGASDIVSENDDTERCRDTDGASDIVSENGDTQRWRDTDGASDIVSEDDGGGESDGDALANDSQTDLTGENFAKFMARNWHADFSYFPALPPYSGQQTHGLKLDGMADHTPVDFFDQIFDDAIMTHIVEETNRYAHRCLHSREENFHARSYFRKWEETTVNEMYGFFSILFHMGLNHKPEVGDYWSKDPILQTPFAPNIMPRARFLPLLAMLHVSNSEDYVPPGREDHDPLHKIQPVYQHLRDRYKALYVPGDSVCLDQTLCPWRGGGKLDFRAYLKDNPVKRGIKLYQLCESSSGYVYDFEIFAAHPTLSSRPADVVMRITEPLLGQGRTVFVGGHFCCLDLAERLVRRDTHCVGAVRLLRPGMPRHLAATHVAGGCVYALRRGAVAVLKWIDNNKKPFHLITTRTDPSEMVEVTTGAGKKTKPKAVQDYAACMTGVDKSDRLVAYMPMNRKTLRWWKKLFFHLLTLSLIQASILHAKHRGAHGLPSMPLKKFIASVGNALSTRYHAGAVGSTATKGAYTTWGGANATTRGGANTTTRGGANTTRGATTTTTTPTTTSTTPQGTATTTTPPSSSPSHQSGPHPGSDRSPPVQVPTPQGRLGGGHFSTVLPPTPTGKKNYRRCHVCTARSKGQRGVKLRQSANWCATCGVTLCEKLCQGRGVTCFQVYHTVKKYADY